MSDFEVQDRLTEAMGAARRTLRTRPMDSLKVTVATFFGSMTLSGVAIAEFVQAQMMQPKTGWAAFLGIALVTGPAVYAALEVRRLLDRNDAFGELFHHVKTYESQLTDLRQERDSFRERVIELAHRNSAMANVTSLIAAGMRAHQGREDG